MRYLLPIIIMTAFGVAAALAQPDTIIFPHDLHCENEVECTDCHEAASSTAAADRLLPDMDVCADCHDTDDDENCAMCHTNADEAGDYPHAAYGAAHFGHAQHLDRGLNCQDCHDDPAAARPVMPGKRDCRVCHETGEDYADCRMCHEENQELLPVTHGATWMSGHGLSARENEARCYQCHTETTCSECHAGDNVRPRSHDLHYRFDHALDARGNQMQCAVCHQDPTYCSSCHIAERVLPTNHSQTGWVSSTGGGRHATEAVFNMESCISCHADGASDPSCARCHGGE